MAAEPTTGMAKADMKKLLSRSKAEPVYCAIGQAADGTGLLMLDKIKQPKTVENEMKKAFPDAKLTRFGTAFVDVDQDAKLAKFRINRAASGLARRLIKTLRGTGFNKVEIVLDEEVIDSASAEEDEREGAGQGEGAAQSAAPAEAQPPAESAAPTPDAPTLTRGLTALAQRIGQADPARKAELVGLATQAQAALKGGNLQAAAGLVAQLGQAMGDGAAASPAAAAAGADAYAKVRQAWTATRKKVETDLDKLRAEIVATFPDHAADLASRFQATVAPVLQTLDGRLSDTLEQAGKEQDPQQRTNLVQQAQATIKEHEAFVANSPIIADLDGNPFTPLAIAQVMTATLSALAKSVR